MSESTSGSRPGDDGQPAPDEHPAAPPQPADSWFTAPPGPASTGESAPPSPQVQGVPPQGPSHQGVQPEGPPPPPEGEPWGQPTPPYGAPPTPPYGAPPAPGYGAPATPYYPPPETYAGPRTNSFAIASFICSLAGLVTGLSAIAGIILGHIALGQIKRSGEEGRSYAVAGLAIGYALVGLGILALVAVFFFIAVIGAVSVGTNT